MTWKGWDTIFGSRCSFTMWATSASAEKMEILPEQAFILMTVAFQLTRLHPKNSITITSILTTRMLRAIAQNLYTWMKTTLSRKRRGTQILLQPENPFGANSISGKRLRIQLLWQPVALFMTRTTT